MVDHWDWIEATYAHDKSYDYFPRYASAICNTQAWAKKYFALFDSKRDEVELKRNIVIGIAEIDARVAWLERDLKAVQDFFKKRFS
jgi:hypothetical protein